jgi:hypothetical protein
MAGPPRKPNHQLAMFIAEAGFSNKGLARRIVDLGTKRGYPDLKYNHSSVERWLRGEQPRPPTPDLLAELFSIALGRPIAQAELGMAQGRRSAKVTLSMPSTSAEAADIVHGLSEDDLGRRRVLIWSGYDLVAYSSAALRWMLAPRTAMTSSKGTRSIGMAEVAEIREATSAFQVLDNRLAGGRIRPTVVEYLHTDISPLLRDSEAIDLAQAACLAGRRAGLPLLQAEAIVTEAHAHALRQDTAACSRALRRAETIFNQATGRGQPTWLTYFDGAYFAAKIAHCFHTLGQGQQTERYALRSLQMNPRYIRGKAFNTALLALGYAQQGELDPACMHGRAAADLASSLDSVRAVSYIRKLLRELAPRAEEQRAREFRAYAEMALPALLSRA